MLPYQLTFSLDEIEHHQEGKKAKKQDKGGACKDSEDNILFVSGHRMEFMGINSVFYVIHLNKMLVLIFCIQDN